MIEDGEGRRHSKLTKRQRGTDGEGGRGERMIM